MENKACFATPPACGDGLAVERRDSSNASKLVFAEETNAAKKFRKACRFDKKKVNAKKTAVHQPFYRVQNVQRTRSACP